MERQYGKNIKLLRMNKGLKQKDLAKALNVSDSLISLWEKNKREPDIDMLKNLSDFFNVSLDDLINGGKPEDLKVVIQRSYKIYKLDEIESKERTIVKIIFLILIIFFVLIAKKSSLLLASLVFFISSVMVFYEIFAMFKIRSKAIEYYTLDISHALFFEAKKDASVLNKDYKYMTTYFMMSILLGFYFVFIYILFNESSTDMIIINGLVIYIVCLWGFGIFQLIKNFLNKKLKPLIGYEQFKAVKTYKLIKLTFIIHSMVYMYIAVYLIYSGYGELSHRLSWLLIFIPIIWVYHYMFILYFLRIFSNYQVVYKKIQS